MNAGELPGCDEVFELYFGRWITPADREHRPFKATRPDVERCAPPKTHAAVVQLITEEGRDLVRPQIANMLGAAKADWQSYLDVAEPLRPEWIRAFDEFWSRERVAEVFQNSDPEHHANQLVVLCCEFGAVLGELLIQDSPSREWLYDWPYWESAVFDPETGCRINVFHWAIKRFSEYGLEDGYLPKFHACLKFLGGQARPGGA